MRAKIILLLFVGILVTSCRSTEATPTPASPTPVVTETAVSPPTKTPAPTPALPTPVVTETALSPSTKTPAPTTAPSNGPITADEYAVYRAIIEWGYLTESTKLIVIYDHTSASLSPEEFLDERTVEYIRDNMGSALEPETLNDYLTKNEATYELEERFPLDAEYLLVSEAEIKEIFEKGEGWDQFYATYPDSQGFMTLSRAGFNANMDQALAYVGNQAHYLAGAGYYVLLTKEEGAWVVENLVLAWIS